MTNEQERRIEELELELKELKKKKAKAVEQEQEIKNIQELSQAKIKAADKILVILNDCELINKVYHYHAKGLQLEVLAAVRELL